MGTLPRRTALGLGAALGRVAARLGVRRDVALINLGFAFPDWSEGRRDAVYRESLANQGRHLAEIAQLRRTNRDNVRRWLSVEGIEHLHDAQKDSPTGGVIALTGHFGSWEFLATAISLWGIQMCLVHRGQRNPYIEPLVHGWRERAGVGMLRRGHAARAVLRGLKDGAIVAMPIDQDTPRNEAIFVPFFDRLAATRDAPARIAARTGAPVVPVFLFRQGNSARHVARFFPPIELVPGKEPAAIAENTARMNAAIEAAIRLAPEQWIWAHRRFRVQPAGTPRVYPRSRRSPIAPG